MSDKREELIKLLGTAALVIMEWYMMQPYHSPLMATIWRWSAAICGAIAETFGWFRLIAERNYYLAVASGS